MSLPARLLGANPSIQVSTLLSGSLSTPSAKQAFVPPTDYQSISSLNLSGSTTQEITNIPQTFHHLQLRGHVGTTSLNSLEIRFNNDSTSSYMRQAGGMTGSGNTTATTTTATSNYLIANSAGVFSSATIFCEFILDIFNYTDTNWHKMIYSVSGQYDLTGATGVFEIGRGVYQKTTAISSIQLSNMDFRSGSYVALYGMGIK